MHTTTDLDRAIVERAYARWAPTYDSVCGPIFENGRRAAAQAARCGAYTLVRFRRQPAQELAQSA